jgi:hypothetical protein
MVELHTILASIFVLLATAPAAQAVDVDKHLRDPAKLLGAPRQGGCGR